MGGICFPAHLPERDGIMAALMVVEARAKAKKPLSEMVAELEAEIGKMTYVVRDIELDASSIQAFRNILPLFSIFRRFFRDRSRFRVRSYLSLETAKSSAGTRREFLKELNCS
jgi:phosphomannomutase